jgi:hypothetical protein
MPAETPKIRVERWSKTISHDDRCGVTEVMDEKNKNNHHRLWNIQ